jgi:hypothetical protein
VSGRVSLRFLAAVACLSAFGALGLGGSAGGTFDPSPPVITPVIHQGTLGLNGWFVSNLTLGWSWHDPDSGVSQTSGCDVKTFASETSGTSVTCSATNGAGVSGAYTFIVKIDKTPPAVSAAADRQPDFAGWYTRTLSVTFAGSDQLSGLDKCSDPVAYSGPDTAAGQVTGNCRDRAGNQAPISVPLKYDATAPSVTGGAPARRPDRYGWFSRSVRIVFAGADATSGIASCDAPVYAGPNSAQATVTGSCRDGAGNVSAPGVFALKYSRPLLTPASGRNVTAPVVLRWVAVERARLYNVQLWRGKQKILSIWPSRTAYRLKRSWRYQGDRYTLVPGKRYRWHVWPRIGSRYGRLLGKSYIDIVR